MNRYEAMFSRVKAKGEGAFIPFAMLGDPDPETSFAIIQAMIEGGADGLELGMPFSDPVADGPTIQLAAQRALAHGFENPQASLDLVRRVRVANPQIPIGLLTYANLAFHAGIAQFYQNCAAAGVDSVLLADVPVCEGAAFSEAAITAGIDPVFIAPPNANAQQLDGLARLGRGYSYVVTRYGVTGAQQSLQLQHDQLLQALKQRNAPPPVMGFGISNRDAVRAAIRSGAAGAISGSALVQIIERHLADRDTLIPAIRSAVADLKAGTRD
ncbi:MAG: tryptophan synthase subunit alpha [Acidobacteria bacterium]|nr:tryptophan synthase subunit alpha [Acidobacteriota bacterium]